MDGRTFLYYGRDYDDLPISGVCIDVLEDEEIVDLMDVNSLQTYWFATDRRNDLVLKELHGESALMARETYVANYLADIMSEIIYNLGKEA